MTEDSDFKQIVHNRAAKTGESYQAARRILERKRGRFSARVKSTFDRPAGRVLGCIMEDGKVTRGMKVTVTTPDGFKHQGVVVSLRHMWDDIDSVSYGEFGEFGLLLNPLTSDRFQRRSRLSIVGSAAQNGCALESSGARSGAVRARTWPLERIFGPRRPNGTTGFVRAKSGAGLRSPLSPRWTERRTGNAPQHRAVRLPGHRRLRLERPDAHRRSVSLPKMDMTPYSSGAACMAQWNRRLRDAGGLPSRLTVARPR